jgi:hypothetical protein
MMLSIGENRGDEKTSSQWLQPEEKEARKQ